MEAMGRVFSVRFLSLSSLQTASLHNQGSAKKVLQGRDLHAWRGATSVRTLFLT